jgi:hypothetical protein
VLGVWLVPVDSPSAPCSRPERPAEIGRLAALRSGALGLLFRQELSLALEDQVHS